MPAVEATTSAAADDAEHLGSAEAEGLDAVHTIPDIVCEGDADAVACDPSIRTRSRS